MAFSPFMRSCRGLCGTRKYSVIAVRSLHSRLISSRRLLTSSASRLGSLNPDSEVFQSTPIFTSEADKVLDGVDKTREVVDMASLGLGGYWPSGWIQSSLEAIYNHAHLPWWVSIVALTILLRISVLPLAVKMQIVAAKLAVINKDAKVIHAKIQECKESGDTVNEAKAGVEMMELYRRHGVHPLAMIPLGFAQIPIFFSMFRGLREMAVLPVESMKTGGNLWFVDLTVPDPTFALPLLACGSFLVNIQLGGEGGAVEENELSRRVRWILRAGSVFILPFTVQFPAAVLLYWVSNSVFSTVQILLFKSHAVKNLFGIPIVKRN